MKVNFLDDYLEESFSRTDKSLKWIDKYDDRKHFYRRGGACGPWVCGYILYVNQGKDKYDFFYNNASSFGEFGILNFALRLFGRPMTPGEMGGQCPLLPMGKYGLIQLCALLIFCI